MNYLIEKTVLTIEPTLALKIGLNESIVLKQLHYWIKKSKKNHNGKKWVFNTYKQWKEQLPFFSEKTIQRIILNLKEIGLIEIQQIDKNKMNRTNFYSINYEKIDQLFENLKILSETPPITKQEENKKLKEKKPNEGGGFYSQEFLKFWENYPKKIGKKLAMVEFEKLEEINKEKAISGALKYAKKVEATDEQYIKTPKNWLKDEYFEDYQIDVKIKPIKINKLETLASKIANLIKENITPVNPFWEQMKGAEFIFDEFEKNTLKNLGGDFNFYKEIEFQDGEIQAYLKGVLQDD